MNLYLVKNTTNNDWETYSSMVVSAESEYDARRIHPNRHIKHNKEKDYAHETLSLACPLSHFHGSSLL